jgi:hypothetical protein
MDWKGQLAMAIGIFAVIAVVVVYVIPATSNRLPLRSDVRVGKIHEEQSGGIISLLHYEVWGKVVNNGTLPSGPVTVTLNITSLKGHCCLRQTHLSSRILYHQDGRALSRSNSLLTI